MKKYCAVVAGVVLIILISSFKFLSLLTKKFPILMATGVGPMLKPVSWDPNIQTSITEDSITCTRMISPCRDMRRENFLRGPFLWLKLSKPCQRKITLPRPQRHHMDVMQKDSLKFASTGGWGYAQFERDNSRRMLTLEQKKACNTCHLKQNDHVFSTLRKVQ